MFETFIAVGFGFFLLVFVVGLIARLVQVTVRSYRKAQRGL